MPDSNAFWIVAFRPDCDDPQADINEKLGPSGVLGKPPGPPNGNKEATGLGELKLPQFQTAPLSTLIALSETLAKQDPIATSTLLKTLETLRTLSPPSAPSGVDENLLMDDGRSYDEYLRQGWQWNRAKYRFESRKLEDLADALARDMQGVDNVQKAKTSAYNLAKGQVQQNKRKQTGNLSVRNLADVVSKDDFPSLDSEYLQTLLVAVPKNLLKEFVSSYERLASMVVPRSASLLATDDEFGLFNVTLFKKVKDEFAQKCRERKWHVREFVYDENEIEKARRAAEEVEAQEKSLRSELLKLTRINFAEAFSILVHIKVLRTYVECLLRYGLPAHFFVAALKPEPRLSKRLLTSLTSYVGSLDTASPQGKGRSSRSARSGQAGADADVGGEYATVLDEELFDFVLFELVDPAAEAKGE